MTRQAKPRGSASAIPPGQPIGKASRTFADFLLQKKKTLFQMRRTPRTRWEKGKGASSTSVAVALYCTRWEYFSALESGTYQNHMRARFAWF